MFHSILDPQAAYPEPPFAPAELFPELAGLAADCDPDNRLFGLFRNLLRRAGCDAGRFGSPDWNPLGHLVRGRSRIVIKPNLVLHKVGELPCSIQGLVVHASVIRLLVDYLLLAARKLQQPLEIVIADTPLQSADFDRLCEQNGLAELMRHYRAAGEPVSLLDLRSEHAVVNEQLSDPGAAAPRRRPRRIGRHRPRDRLSPLRQEPRERTILGPGLRRRRNPAESLRPGPPILLLEDDPGRRSDHQPVQAEDARQGRRHPGHEEHHRR